MPQYLYRIQPTRLAILTEGPTAQEANTIGQHLAYLKELVGKGQVLMAGRTTNSDPSTFGIVIFVADSDPEAVAIMHADPAVAQGVMSAELYPYRVALWSPTGPQLGA